MRQSMRSGGGRLLVGAVTALCAVTGLVACNGDDGDTASGTNATASATSSDSRFSVSPTATDPGRATTSATESETPTSRPTRTPTRTPTESATPESTKTAYDKGECLSGTINESGGEQEQLDSVECSAPSANFKVLRVFPYLLASRPCDAVSGTDFTYSSYWTRNGVPTTGSTYCLSQIG